MDAHLSMRAFYLKNDYSTITWTTWKIFLPNDLAEAREL